MNPNTQPLIIEQTTTISVVSDCDRDRDREDTVVMGAAVGEQTYPVLIEQYKVTQQYPPLQPPMHYNQPLGAQQMYPQPMYQQQMYQQQMYYPPGPPQYGQEYVMNPMGPQPQVVFVQQLGQPVCPSCGYIGSASTRSAGCVTFSWCTCLFCFTGFLGFWIPFCIDSCYDINVICARCGLVKSRVEASCC